MAGACGIIRGPGLFFQLDGSGYPGDVADNPGGVSVARKVLCQVDVSGPKLVDRPVGEPDLRFPGQGDYVLPARSNMPIAKRPRR